MISVQNLWLLYVGALIVFGIVFGIIVAKCKNLGYSSAVLITTLLSGLVVYLTATYNVDPNTLTATDQTSLNALYLTMLILIALSFFLCIIELAVGSAKAAKDAVHSHLEMSCDAKTGKCEVKEVEVCRKKDGVESTARYECVDGQCSPTDYFMTDRNNNTITISYLA